MTSATNAGFFISLPMLFTPVIALALMRRTYRLSTLVLQIAVLAGLYLLCCNGGALSFGMGEFVGLGSSALFALGIVLSERGLSEIGPAAMSAVQTGGAFLFSLAARLRPSPRLPSAPFQWARGCGCLPRHRRHVLGVLAAE